MTCIKMLPSICKGFGSRNHLAREGSSVSFIFQDWQHECLHTGYSCIYLNLSLAIFLVPIHLIYWQIKELLIQTSLLHWK